MLSHNYSYQQCLDNSLKVSWDESQLLEGKNFDFSKAFLPDSLVGTAGISCLNDDEKRKFNQITGNSYCHLFQYVEEFLIALVVESAMNQVLGDDIRLRALLRFGEEELKHQELFRRAITLFGKGFGSECGLIPGQVDVAKAVLGTSRLCGFMLGDMLEWLTQAHYLEHVRDTADLDPLFSDMLRHHWLEEAQHTKMDTLIMDELVGDLSLEDREKAVDELLALCGAVDGLLKQQVELNVESLATATGRAFTDEEKQEIAAAGHKAFRWGFLAVGLEHPKFVQVVKELTEAGPAKIAAAAQTYSA